MAFTGNYLWTHYFYVVLKARYTFPTTWHLNQVPIYLYLISHAYFCSYHTFSTVVLRRFRTSGFCTKLAAHSKLLLLCLNVITVFVLGFVIAFMEAFSISSVPYYSYPDVFWMYTVGSMFYGIYFYVSFPMFYRLDEEKDDEWTVSRTTFDSLACCMIVTLLLDFWRLCVGLMMSSHAADSVPFVY